LEISVTDKYQSWPFREAKKIRDKSGTDDGETVLFETGYGPSGLPHVGTFSEVARTTWVKRAFERISDQPTDLFVFSDDMDGLRKVPQNIPRAAMLEENLGKPLCDIPDPYGEEESFSAYMNRKLESFLNSFGFEYTFKASSDQYRGGTFDEGLKAVAEKADAIKDVILPTLREQNRQDWSPFFPICENCGKVYTTRVIEVSGQNHSVKYACDSTFNGIEPCGHGPTEMSVTGGNVKVGWKVDWALRWFVFDVDYEMYGKDLIESAELSSEIVDILGGTPPVGFFYEMFLDENGQKISKSVGKGLTIEEWQEYAPLEGLGWFIFRSPQKAKKFHTGAIPQNMDRYLRDRHAFGELPDDEKPDNPIWFVERNLVDSNEDVGYQSDTINYSMLLNVINVLNTEDRAMVWDYIDKYDPDAREDKRLIDNIVEGAINYYQDFIRPNKTYKPPADDVMPAVNQFRAFLEEYDGDSAEELQNAAYQAGKDNDVSLGKWFTTMYRILLGQDNGPRLGSFVHFYGVDNTLELLDERLSDAESE
jgi:lysyl-tRNA synthetase class 1